jgi:hypothetical protein
MHRSDRLSLAIKEVANSVVNSIKKKGTGAVGDTTKNTKSSNPLGVSSVKTKQNNPSINNDEEFQFKGESWNSKEEVKKIEEEKSAKSNFFE